MISTMSKQQVETAVDRPSVGGLTANGDDLFWSGDQVIESVVWDALRKNDRLPEEGAGSG